MPIKPENKNRYPDNWDEIRETILTRANYCCEFCGVPNHVYGVRLDEPYDGAFMVLPNQKAAKKRHGTHLEGFKIYGLNAVKVMAFNKKIIRIVLTIAHLDHKPENNDPDNLRALCQRCHNNHDKDHRAANRRGKRGPYTKAGE